MMDDALDDDEQDYEFEFEDDEDMDDQNADVENKYYNAKGMSSHLTVVIKADNPRDALREFRDIVHKDEIQSEWCVYTYLWQGLQGFEATN